MNTLGMLSSIVRPGLAAAATAIAMTIDAPAAAREPGHAIVPEFP